MMNKLMNRKGAVMIEYGLLAALIALALVVGVTALSGKLGLTFTDVGNAVHK